MGQEDAVAFSRAIVALCKHVIAKETDSKLWDVVVAQRGRIEEYVSKMGLALMVDEMDGYAYLRQRVYESSEEEIPRLVPRHALSYPVSLLLLLLRKQLLEFDSISGDQRLILTKEQIAERMRLFLRDTTNEAKLLKEIDSHIGRVETLGFLRRLRGKDDTFEVQRIIRSFINAEWLQTFNEKLEEYRQHAEGAAVAEGE